MADALFVSSILNWLPAAPRSNSNVQAPRTKSSSPPGASITPSSDTNSVTTIRPMTASCERLALLLIGRRAPGKSSAPGTTNSAHPKITSNRGDRHAAVAPATHCSVTFTVARHIGTNAVGLGSTGSGSVYRRPEGERSPGAQPAGPRAHRRRRRGRVGVQLHRGTARRRSTCPPARLRRGPRLRPGAARGASTAGGGAAPVPAGTALVGKPHHL